MSPAEVARAQRRLGLRVTGVAGPELFAAVRGFQRDRGLVVTGEFDPPTRAALETVPTDGLVPEWFGTEVEDVVVASRIGGADRESVLRFQSAARLPLTGVVDEATAIRIGD